MDADLEFCLGKFFNDQKNIIDSNLEHAGQILGACKQAINVGPGIYALGQIPTGHVAVAQPHHAAVVGAAAVGLGFGNLWYNFLPHIRGDKINMDELRKIEVHAYKIKGAKEDEKHAIDECVLQIIAKLNDSIWNRVYTWSKTDGQQEVYWSGPIDRGNKPYYCPSGWKRYGIKVAKDAQEFDAKWGHWYIAYHGTADANASKILATGLKISTKGCFYGEGVPRVYVSPSIEYCAHPRYARPWKQTITNGKDRWYQLVFQCRVNPASVNHTGPETLIHNEHKKSVKVDPNFNNGELEWVILGKQDAAFINDDIICYGLMMRVSDVDPRRLKPSTWWEHSLYADCYY